MIIPKAKLGFDLIKNSQGDNDIISNEILIVMIKAIYAVYNTKTNMINVEE